MITEESLRSLLADDELPPSLSPVRVRRRARAIRRNRRAGLVAGVALVLPSLVIGLSRVPVFQGASAGRPLPMAFGADLKPVPLLPEGRVALAFPGQTAWATADEECVSDVPNNDVGGWCRVDSPEETDSFSMGGGALFAVVAEPVVRADFYDGTAVVHAQVVGFALHPQWRTVSAISPWPAEDVQTNKIYLRGWDAEGKLVLSVGCLGGCPAVPQQQPDPANELAPAAKSAGTAAGG